MRGRARVRRHAYYQDTHWARMAGYREKTLVFGRADRSIRGELQAQGYRRGEYQTLNIKYFIPDSLSINLI